MTVFFSYANDRHAEREKNLGGKSVCHVCVCMYILLFNWSESFYAKFRESAEIKTYTRCWEKLRLCAYDPHILVKWNMSMMKLGRIWWYTQCGCYSDGVYFAIYYVDPLMTHLRACDIPHDRTLDGSWQHCVFVRAHTHTHTHATVSCKEDRNATTQFV